MKVYKLIKHIPGCSPGRMFKETEKGYFCRLDDSRYIGFPRDIVENSHDWFEEMKSDVDVLAEWLEEKGKEHYKTRTTELRNTKFIAEELLKLGLDINKIKKGDLNGMD